MSDDHGQGDKGSGDDGAKGGPGRTFMLDRFFTHVVDYVSDEIAKLVAFMLILVFIGAVFGYVVAIKDASFLFILLPAILALIAYYERDLAIILFVALLLFVLL